MYYAYFISSEGEILKSVSSWDSVEEASMNAKLMLVKPEYHILLDEEDLQVTGARIDVSEGFTIEQDDES